MVVWWLVKTTNISRYIEAFTNDVLGLKGLCYPAELGQRLGQNYHLNL